MHVQGNYERSVKFPQRRWLSKGWSISKSISILTSVGSPWAKLSHVWKEALFK